jgi:hypothetical protein
MLHAEVLMGAPNLASGTFSLDANLMKVPLGLIKPLLSTLSLFVHEKYQQ